MRVLAPHLRVVEEAHALLGLQYKQIARALRADESTLHRWRAGETEPSAACQALARAAREKGFEAIRFPSAIGAGQNLAIFLDRFVEGSRLEVVGSEELVLDRT